jgi:hypothetical protein
MFDRPSAVTKLHLSAHDPITIGRFAPQGYPNGARLGKSASLPIRLGDDALQDGEK